MRSIAETGKDGPLAHTAAAALVVGQCCVIALQLLPVDAVAAAAYCTPEGTAQIRPADGFLHNHCPDLRCFSKDFLLTRFSTIVDYHFFIENYFTTMWTRIRSYSVGGGFDYK